MVDVKDIQIGDAMAQETERSWNVSEETKKRWEEHRRRMKESKQRYLEKARQLGVELDATLVAITGFPPGIDADPAVYRSNQHESYFMVAGKKGEVAGPDDPEEIQKKAKRRYSVPLDSIGEHVIVRFDFERRIKEGGVFYAPEGYIEFIRYNPETDPPIIQNQRSTPL
jgi:hypothetical protein